MKDLNEHIRATTLKGTRLRPERRRLSGWWSLVTFVIGIILGALVL